MSKREERSTETSMPGWFVISRRSREGNLDTALMRMFTTNMLKEESLRVKSVNCYEPQMKEGVEGVRPQFSQVGTTSCNAQESLRVIN